MAEMTGALYAQELVKNALGIKRFAARRALSAANGDTIKFAGLTTITAVLALCADDGTLGTWTIATNVLTVTNGGTKKWTAIVEGV